MAVSSGAQAELHAIDAIAVFEFTDQQIQDYCSTIDSLSPELSSEFIKALRDVGDRLNEPDLQPTAFDEPPPWSHPESQERFSKLRSSQDLQHYLDGTGRLPDTQERIQQLRDKKVLNEYFNLSRSDNSTQSQAPSSFLQPPPGNQAQQQQSPLTTRRSRSPQLPARMRGYDLDQAESSAKRKAPGPSTRSPSRRGASQGADQTDRVASSVHSSEEEDLPSAQGLRKRLRTTQSSSTAQPTPSTSTTAAQAKGKGRAKPGPPSSGPRSTLEERTLLGLAKQIPSAESRTRASTRGPSNRSTFAGMSSSTALSIPAQRSSTSRSMTLNISSDDSSDDADGDEDGTTARQEEGRSGEEGPAAAAQKGSAATESRREATAAPAALKEPSASAQEAKLAAPLYEDDIPLSRAAKASKFGWTVAEGYEGFKYLSSFWKAGKIKESWLCLKCNKPKTASEQGKPANLKTHLQFCKGSQNTTVAAGSANVAPAGDEGQDAVLGSSTLAGGSYRGTSVSGWLNAHQALDIDLTRRLALVCVVRNALPFTLMSSTSMKAVIRSLDHRATISFKSASTIRRDLETFHTQLRNNLKRELHGIDTLMSVQHDGWTNKGFQHSFLAIIGSYVNKEWQYQERLLFFDVVKDKYCGATFAGHLVRTINALKLDDSWYGAVTSDSAGTNTRMLTLLEEDLQDERMQERTPAIHEDDPVVQKLLRASCSSFPRASLRNSGSWNATDYKILCLNHHINLAVRDGFAKFGVKMKTKTQQKVLPIQPKPAIVVNDENGEVVVVSDDDGSDSEGDDQLANQGGADGTEIEDVEEEEVPEDDAPGMGPEDEDIGSDDEGGPKAGVNTSAEAIAAQASSASMDTTENTTNAVGKLEAFTTYIHRSVQRKADFRRRMAKEYHLDETGLANAPFPSKPNKTRWNFHYAMMRGALKIRVAIDAHSRAHIGVRNGVLGDYLLTDSQWRQLTLMEPILKLAMAVTKKMERSEGTLCNVLDYHASLRDAIDRNLRLIAGDADLDAETKAEMKKFLGAMEKKLHKYRDIALRNRLTLAASLLHPNNRRLFHISYPAYRATAETALRELLDELVDTQDRGPSPPSKDPAAPEIGTSLPSPCSAARQLREQDANTEEHENRSDNEEDEVAQYLNPKICPWRASDGTPYKWWRDNEKVFPTLSKLARIILAISGSSSAVERVFSQAALVSTNRRGSLSAATISQLVTTRHWLTHGADELAGLSEQALKVSHSHKMLPSPDTTKARKKK